jgi:type II secretion system protein I
MSARVQGFTLLEILVALAISGIALIVVLQLFGANLNNISISEDYVFAVTKAEAKMREIMDDKNLTEGLWSEATPEGYKIAVSIKDSQKERTQNLKVKLMEIDLTIYWTRTLIEKALTLKSMKVVNKRI